MLREEQQYGLVDNYRGVGEEHTSRYVSIVGSDWLNVNRTQFSVRHHCTSVTVTLPANVDGTQAAGLPDTKLLYRTQQLISSTHLIYPLLLGEVTACCLSRHCFLPPPLFFNP